ncbi:MAG: DUF1003 domain-containing protein [Chitinophagaceae bacterium]
MKYRRAAEIYAKLRTGKSFLIFLSLFCVIWVLWNLFLPKHIRFDEPGFPLLTLILSIEASLSISLVIMAEEESNEIQKNQIILLLHQSEVLIQHSNAVIALLKGKNSVLEGKEKLLDDIEEIGNVDIEG